MFKSLHTRCKHCYFLMFIRPDNPDVVYCGCEGSEYPSKTEEEKKAVLEMIGIIRL